jgi:tetratricopeptide (TPR) repeat protein
LPFLYQEEWDRAIIAIKIKGDDPQGHINLARALETMHIYADAVQSYDRAAELLPDDRTVKDDREECMRKLERSIDLA